MSTASSIVAPPLPQLTLENSSTWSARPYGWWGMRVVSRRAAQRLGQRIFASGMQYSMRVRTVYSPSGYDRPDRVHARYLNALVERAFNMIQTMRLTSFGQIVNPKTDACSEEDLQDIQMTDAGDDIELGVDMDMDVDVLTESPRMCSKRKRCPDTFAGALNEGHHLFGQAAARRCNERRRQDAGWVLDMAQFVQMQHWQIAQIQVIRELGACSQQAEVVQVQQDVQTQTSACQPQYVQAEETVVAFEEPSKFEDLQVEVQVYEDVADNTMVNELTEAEKSFDAEYDCGILKLSSSCGAFVPQEDNLDYTCGDITVVDPVVQVVKDTYEEASIIEIIPEVHAIAEPFIQQYFEPIPEVVAVAEPIIQQYSLELVAAVESISEINGLNAEVLLKNKLDVPQQHEAIPQQFEVAPQQYEVVPQQYEAVPQQYEATTSQQFTITPQQFEVYNPPQQFEVTPQLLEVIPPHPLEVVPQQFEVNSPQQFEVNSSQQFEVNPPQQHEVIPQLLEVIPPHPFEVIPSQQCQANPQQPPSPRVTMASYIESPEQEMEDVFEAPVKYMKDVCEDVLERLDVEMGVGAVEDEPMFDNTADTFFQFFNRAPYRQSLWSSSNLMDFEEEDHLSDLMVTDTPTKPTDRMVIDTPTKPTDFMVTDTPIKPVDLMDTDTPTKSMTPVGMQIDHPDTPKATTPMKYQKRSERPWTIPHYIKSVDDIMFVPTGLLGGAPTKDTLRELERRRRQERDARVEDSLVHMTMAFANADLHSSRVHVDPPEFVEGSSSRPLESRALGASSKSYNLRGKVLSDIVNTSGVGKNRSRKAAGKGFENQLPSVGNSSKVRKDRKKTTKTYGPVGMSIFLNPRGNTPQGSLRIGKSTPKKKTTRIEVAQTPTPMPMPTPTPKSTPKSPEPKPAPAPMKIIMSTTPTTSPPAILPATMPPQTMSTTPLSSTTSDDDLAASLAAFSLCDVSPSGTSSSSAYHAGASSYGGSSGCSSSSAYYSSDSSGTSSGSASSSAYNAGDSSSGSITVYEDDNSLAESHSLGDVFGNFGLVTNSCPPTFKTPQPTRYRLPVAPSPIVPPLSVTGNLIDSPDPISLAAAPLSTTPRYGTPSLP